MSIQIIISTMQSNISLLDSSLIEFQNVMVINQDPIKKNNSIKKNLENDINWFDFDAIGLSKSRNMGIRLATDEYIYLTDDDIVINENFDFEVNRAIKNNPDVDILAFQVGGIEKEYKSYKEKEKDINYLGSLQLSSVQLVMKKSFIMKHRLQYDESFGAGAKYKMGEENIFLIDALRKGARIKYVPIEIAKVHVGESSWFTGFNKEYFFNRGAIFERMFNKYSSLFSLIFCIRKHKLYKKEFSTFEAFKFTQEGRKDYLSNNHN